MGLILTSCADIDTSFESNCYGKNDQEERKQASYLSIFWPDCTFASEIVFLSIDPNLHINYKRAS